MCGGLSLRLVHACLAVVRPIAGALNPHPMTLEMLGEDSPVQGIVELSAHAAFGARAGLSEKRCPQLHDGARSSPFRNHFPRESSSVDTKTCSVWGGRRVRRRPCRVPSRRRTLPARGNCRLSPKKEGTFGPIAA